MKYQYTLAIDPSGNFNEGKGTTGWVLWNNVKMKIAEIGTISAKDYDTYIKYWAAHKALIDRFAHLNMSVVIEDYVLYQHKANNQINSRMETPKLIGVVQVHCAEQNLLYVMQMASEVKTRWSDAILKHKGYLPEGKIIKHVKDAIRHAVHFATFKNKED